jgi:hypothetical protein
MNNCPMCGNEIFLVLDKYVCSRCGSDYSFDFFDPGYVEKAIFNNPIWGEVVVDFSSFTGGKSDFFERIKDFWSSSELNPVTRLALFPGQFKNIASDAENIVLYASEEMHYLMEEFFSKDIAEGVIFRYTRLPLDEIMAQQKMRAKFK